MWTSYLLNCANWVEVYYLFSLCLLSQGSRNWAQLQFPWATLFLLLLNLPQSWLELLQALISIWNHLRPRLILEEKLLTLLDSLVRNQYLRAMWLILSLWRNLYSFCLFHISILSLPACLYCTPKVLVYLEGLVSLRDHYFRSQSA